MKKTVASILFLFTFSLTSQAQTTTAKSELSNEAKAKETVEEVTKVINISNDNLLRGLYLLFLDKQESLSKPEITAQEKIEISNRVREKINASFTSEQLFKIGQTPGLFDKLTK